MSHEKECGREVTRDAQCIFHLKEKADEEAKQFDRAFPGELERLEKSEESVIDLTRFVFPGPLDMMRRTFSKPVVFEKAVFSDGARFTETRFLGDARFDGVIFSGYAVFLWTTFSRDARFSGATFSGGVSFDGTAFLHVASFPGVTFSHNASFERAMFSSDARFDDATFTRVIFRENVFRRILQMGARFEGLAIFERVLFQRDTIESSDLCALLEPTPPEHMPLTFFSGASVGPNGEVRFIQPREYNARLKVERNFAIDRVSFLNADLSRFSFLDVEWGRYHNRRGIIEEALMGRTVFEDATPDQIRQICARLRANQEKAFRYAEAGDFFIGEMNMRRHSVRDEGWRALPERFLLWLFSGLSRYGESISRPTLAAVVIVFGLAALRLIVGEPSEWHTYQPLSVEESLARSVASFFQLRSTTLWTDILERLVSIPILGVLFIALKRKLERRP